MIVRMIAVVISTLDRPELLARCLDALARGTRRPAEVIVVNQGTVDAVEDVVARARADGLPVVHVPLSGRGLSRSQNAGVRAATSTVIAVVDDDCVPAPDWVEIVEETFAADGAPDLLGGRVLPLPPRGDRVLAVSTRAQETPAELRWPALPWQVGTGGNFAVRRSSYLDAGGNDELLGTGTPGRAGNDIDLFYRVLRNGGVARYDPKLVVHHERATAAEFRARRGSYGFGVGAAAGRWLREGDREARRVLRSWLRLRIRLLRRRRAATGVSDELRVLLGTARGLVYGLRLGPRRDAP
jgi:glycosyltransferase involved in cell wall biosynthesis